MITLRAPADALTAAERIIQLLEQRHDELPFAKELLATYRPAYQELARSKAYVEDSVAAWQAALAQRWACEVAGSRVFKHISQQLVAFYGSADAPEVQLVACGGAEEHRTPSELLTDLRRMAAALQISQAQLPFAEQRLQELTQTCAALDIAIAETSAREAERRIAVLEQRIVQEAQRRLRGAAQQQLTTFYGGHMPADLAEAFR